MAISPSNAAAPGPGGGPSSGSARKKEDELRRLREMDEFKTRFLNMAAHELNTPLTPLRLQTHLLLTGSLGALDERQRRAIDILDRNVKRLADLVHEILDVARLQANELRLQTTAVEVGPAISEVIDAYEETAKRVGIRLVNLGNPGLVILADRSRLIQILFNLISNALKFTPAGGEVVVRAFEDSGRVVIEVHDTGVGLSREQMARLFQAFSQVHDPMAVSAPGTGLGLFISKGLLQAMGGDITVESKGPGKGSTFRFYLPVASPLPGGERRPKGTSGGRDDRETLAARLRELI
jgi:signal transduction histidine kinase